MSLPANLIIEKNKTSSPHPWILLCKITLTDVVSTVLRLAQHTEDLYFNDGSGSELYLKFPFNLETNKITSKGEISRLTLTMSNVTRYLQPYLEDLSGAIGSTVKLMVVNFQAQTNNAIGKVADYADLIQTYTVIGCVSDSRVVTFTLGAPSPLRKVCPLNKYMALHCRWQFDTSATPSPECNYRVDGDALGKSVCDRTWEDCKAHDNSTRFGGFIGLQSGGTRIV